MGISRVSRDGYIYCTHGHQVKVRERVRVSTEERITVNNHQHLGLSSKTTGFVLKTDQKDITVEMTRDNCLPGLHIIWGNSIR